MTRFAPAVQQVLDALREGADCQHDIQELTGLCKVTVHYALRRLVGAGAVRITDRTRKIGRGGISGRMRCYEPRESVR